MAAKSGSLSINSENIFPIIKKWLYSDHDIFYRELISNGCDAVTKLKKLDMMGEYTLPEGYKGRVDVIVDDASPSITADNRTAFTVLFFILLFLSLDQNRELIFRFLTF